MPSKLPKNDKNRKLNKKHLKNSNKVVQMINESIEEMLTKVLEYKSNDNFNEAIKLARVIYTKYPENEDAADMLSELLYESGEFDKCKTILQKAVQNFPNSGAQKYLMLGELESGLQSLEYYKRALSIMEKDYQYMKSKLNINDPEEVASMEVLQSAIAEAYCSVADLIMSDLPEMENAEQQCVAALESARSYEPNSAHVLQTFASCRISQSMFDEARNLMSFMLNSSTDFIDTPDQFKINTGRILIELDMLDEARKVFEDLRHDATITPEIAYYSGISEKLSKNYLKALILFNKFLPDLHGKVRQTIKSEMADCKAQGGQEVIKAFEEYLKKKEEEDTMDTEMQD